MAGTTGLEPAASAVTGQRSNQLNYVPYNQYFTDSLSSVTGGYDRTGERSYNLNYVRKNNMGMLHANTEWGQ